MKWASIIILAAVLCGCSSTPAPVEQSKTASEGARRTIDDVDLVAKNVGTMGDLFKSLSAVNWQSVKDTGATMVENTLSLLKGTREHAKQTANLATNQEKSEAAKDKRIAELLNKDTAKQGLIWLGLVIAGCCTVAAIVAALMRNMGAVTVLGIGAGAGVLLMLVGSIFQTLETIAIGLALSAAIVLAAIGALLAWKWWKSHQENADNKAATKAVVEGFQEAVNEGEAVITDAGRAIMHAKQGKHESKVKAIIEGMDIEMVKKGKPPRKKPAKIAIVAAPEPMVAPVAIAPVPAPPAPSPLPPSASVVVMAESAPK